MARKADWALDWVPSCFNGPRLRHFRGMVGYRLGCGLGRMVGRGLGCAVGCEFGFVAGAFTSHFRDLQVRGAGCAYLGVQ